MGKQHRHASNFMKKIKDQDMFGKPISLTLKGEDTFKTVCGGVASIFTVTVFLVFVYIKTVMLIFKTDS